MDEKLFQYTASTYYIFQNMPDNVMDDWDRYISTNGADCEIVDSKYEPKPGEMVFFGSISAGDFEVVLHKRGDHVLIKNGPMLIEKYTPDWVTHFNDLKNQIEAVLSGLEISIEHVGSTAVPNLDSKPIIDIDIVYTAKPDFEKIKLGLEKIGYYHNGNQGLEGREVFKRSGKLSNEVLDHIKHHLYVCPTDSKALERHLLSRDYLRKNEWARIKYQQMKYELAEQANQDRKKYQELKELLVNDFIDSIIAEEKMTLSH